MGRVLLIVSLAAGLTLNGGADATTADEVRLPIGRPQGSILSTTVVVETGDHLWGISEQRLQESSPSAPVDPYWREVVARNTPRLRSGNPDLIYPGEVIELPEISERQ